MNKNGALAAALLSCVLLFPMAAQNPPVVRIQPGEVQGVRERQLYVFKGIPYAQPPVGELRWREPQPPAPWTGVRSAESYGNACMQTPGLSEANGGYPGPLSEDCLYLNVWTPTLDTAARRPVAVWIHGGAYIFGSGSLSVYSGVPLAGQGLVVVTLNYRLAQLGFFAHPALEKENPGGPVNFGLLDQILALKWVQQNIARFGGDPGNVTIMGQSAGGKSVMALFASPLARGLFHKGIAMSSYALPDATRAKAEAVAVRVADALGLKGASASAQELRALPAERFVELKGQEFCAGPVPVAGDTWLPRSIQDTFAAGQEAPRPLILGNTSDDASVVAAFGVDAGKLVRQLGGAGVLVKLLYPGVRGNDELGRQAARDLVFTMPVRWIADRHSQLAPTWRYYFDYTAGNERPKFPKGVPHGGEIEYFLDTLGLSSDSGRGLSEQDHSYALAVSSYVSEFARTNRPASKAHAAWPIHSERQDKTMVFGQRIAVEGNFMRARLNAFIRVLKMVGPFLSR